MALLNTDVFPSMNGLVYNTDKGVIVPFTSDIKKSIETEFTSNDMFGGDFDTTEENIGGRLIEGATRLMTEVLGMCAVNSNQLNFEYAMGRYLDVHAAFYGLTRNGATSTAVTCTLYGTANLIIPKGSMVEDSDGVGYELASDVILNDLGTAEGVFYCEEKGCREVAAGSIRNIRSALPIGWDSVKNESAGVTGQDVESDDSLRRRIRIARRGGNGFINGIYSRVMSVENVKECLVYENCFNSTVYVLANGDIKMTYSSSDNAVPVKPHSIYVVAEYTESDDTDYAVAEAIYKTKSCGSGMTPSLTNSTSVDYAFESGNSCHIPVQSNQTIYGRYVKNIQYLDTIAQNYYKVTFNKPFVKYASVSVSVSRNEYVGSAQDLRSAIVNAVNDYQKGNMSNVDGLKIGQNILAFEIAAAISDSIPSVQVTNVEFRASSNDAPPATPFPSSESFVSGDTKNEIKVKFSSKGAIAIGMNVSGTIRTDVKTIIDGTDVGDESGEGD